MVVNIYARVAVIVLKTFVVLCFLYSIPILGVILAIISAGPWIYQRVFKRPANDSQLERVK